MNDLIEYRATARNDRGWTFQFYFVGNGTEAEAQAHLDALVCEDEQHRKYGPWTPHHITRNA